MGFRFTAEDIALELGISGWVKNLSDGRVELAAEAEEEILKDFLEKIKEYFSGHIRSTDIQWLPAKGAFKEFSIAF